MLAISAHLVQNLAQNWAAKIWFKKLFRTASKLWLCFNGNSMACAVTYEVYKTLNDINLNFMYEIFHRFPNLSPRRNNFYVQSRSKGKLETKAEGHWGHVYGTHYNKSTKILCHVRSAWI